MIDTDWLQHTSSWECRETVERMRLRAEAAEARIATLEAALREFVFDGTPEAPCVFCDDAPHTDDCLVTQARAALTQPASKPQ